MYVCLFYFKGPTVHLVHPHKITFLFDQTSQDSVGVNQLCLISLTLLLVFLYLLVPEQGPN